MKEIQCPCCECFISYSAFEYAVNGKKQWTEMQKRLKELKMPVRKLIEEAKRRRKDVER